MLHVVAKATSNERNQDVLSAARGAYDAADFDSCIFVLESERRTPEQDELLARALLRGQQYAEAEQVLLRSTEQQNALRFVLLAEARARQSDFRSARVYLEKAESISRTPLERHEVATQHALLAWMLGDMNGVTSSLTGCEETPRVHELLGWVAINCESYYEALNHFDSAMILADNDAYSRARAMHTASALGRELYVPEIMARVESYYDTITWTPYIEMQRMHICRALGWFAGAQGRSRDMLGWMRAADDGVVSDAWAVTLRADRATLSLLLGERENAWDHCERALEMAKNVAWDKTCGEERFGLLYVASLVADNNTLDARRLVKTYLQLPPTAPSLTWSTDPRVAALEKFTDGVIQRAERHEAPAIAAFDQAFEIYKRVGYHWRAIMTLLARGWTTEEHADCVHYLSWALQKYPNSLLREYVEHQIRLHSASAESAPKLEYVDGDGL